MEVAEGCIPDQNRPPITILASAKAVDPAVTDDLGLEVERRSTPREQIHGEKDTSVRERDKPPIPGRGCF